MPQLDGLRAFAVLAVLYTHFLPERYWLFDVYWGGAGVRLFFVLSGFLITGILLRENDKLDGKLGNGFELIKRFYIRRYLRLTPVFLVVLIVAAIIDIPNTRETFWWHVFYVSNINFALHNSWQGQVAHFWTLAVEEQFYLIWPLLVLFLSQRSLLRLTVFIVPMVIVYRVIARLAGAEDIAVWVLLPDSMDALCLGALIAILVKHFDLTSSRRLPLMLAGVGLLLWLSEQLIDLPRMLQMADYARTGLAVFFAWLILWASEGHQGLLGRFLELPLLTYIGKISYGIYVVHSFVNFILKKYLFPNSFFDFPNEISMALIAGLSTIALATLSWHFLEKPINKFRRSVTYQPRGTNC